MKKKIVIQNNNVYNFFSNKGKLIFKYDFNKNIIETDSFSKSINLYLNEMDSNLMKVMYDIPPTMIFSDCFQGTRIQLAYPNIAQEKEIQGEVKIKIFIDNYGNVKDYKIIKTIGYGSDSECIRVLNKYSQCWFPAIKNGKTVDSEVDFIFRFKLNE